jgi:hypothetical protein
MILKLRLSVAWQRMHKAKSGTPPHQKSKKFFLSKDEIIKRISENRCNYDKIELLSQRKI